MSRLPSEYTIQEASAKLGVPVQKLRRWDAQGVLVARRTDGGHRRYAREIIDGLARTSLGLPSDKYGDELATARKTLREKRRIIQLLLESEARYRDLVETSHDLIWTTDAQGRFTYLNNGAMDILGIPPKDLLGLLLLRLRGQALAHLQPPLLLHAEEERRGEELRHPSAGARWRRPLDRHQRARPVSTTTARSSASAAPPATSPSSTKRRCRSSTSPPTTR